MNKINLKNIILILFAFFPVLMYAQEENPYDSVPRSIKIVWSGNEYIYRYNVIIEKTEDEVFNNFLQDFTRTPSYKTSLLPGNYRYRIVPHDILDRPGKGTDWIEFEIHSALIYDVSNSPVEFKGNDAVDLEEIILLDVYNLPEVLKEADNIKQETQAKEEPEELKTEVEDLETKNENLDEEEEIVVETEEKAISARFNTIGVSLGTSFIDPLLIASVHGTYAPFKKKHIENIYFELGCDFGFLSKLGEQKIIGSYSYVENDVMLIYPNNIINKVESFYCIYPFVYVGYFYPLNNRMGIFAGIGGGYMFGKYEFSDGDAKLNIFGINLNTGVNLFSFLNVSYTFKTTFKEASHKVDIGYVYRFKTRGEK